MSGKNVNFGNKKTLKSDFYKSKKVVKTDNFDVNEILVSKEEPYGTKNSFSKPLCIKLPQMTAYIRKFEDNLTMSFKISDKQLLKKYNHIWKRVEKLLIIAFDSKPVYGDNDKYIKPKIKIYAGSMIKKFQSKKNGKRKSTIQVLDSVIKAKKKYYPQTLLEECKYKQEKIKMENLIDDDSQQSESDEFG